MFNSTRDKTRFLIHGVFLGTLNLFSVGMIFVIFTVLNISINPNLYWAAALLLCFLLYLLMLAVSKSADMDIMVVPNWRILITVLIISLISGPLLSYATQLGINKDLGTWDGIFKSLPFQILASSICLVFNLLFWNK